MRQSEVKVGGIYIAKVSNRLVSVRLDRIETPSGTRRSVTRFHVTNLRTGRKTVFRSAAKFRCVAAKTEPARIPPLPQLDDSDAEAGMLHGEQLDEVAYLEGEGE